MDEFEGARIVGVYTTQQARDLSSRTGFSLALEAMKGALDDAGMTLDEIDGFCGYTTGYWPGGGGYWAYQLKKEFKWTGGTGIAGILEAARLVSSGYLNAVLLTMGMVRPSGLLNAPWTVSHDEWTAWPGAFPQQPVQFGLVAQRYIHDVGPQALDAMADIAASTRNYGSINPDAVYFGRGPFTRQDVLDSRPIAEPLTLLMCSTVNDGGCAMVIARKDRAASTRRKPVRVLCGAMKTVTGGYHESPTLQGYFEMGQHYRDTVARAGVSHDDINVVEFYDHFASHVLLQYEEFGFCGKGEAPDLVKDGAMKLDGRFPTCTDGGNLSFSHPGLPVLLRPIEVVRQIRGEVKDLCPGWERGEHSYDPAMCRKIRDPKLGFTSNPGSPTLQGSMMVMGPGD
ncbi:MAG: thiolase family protein [Dehalococcoidia bacterium]|nr:thiolase family protein [Dehalococcoidia bacterium]